MTPRRRKDVTESGRWSQKVGEHGSVVRVRERKPGGRVQLHYADPADPSRRRSRYAAVGSVRDSEGRLLPDRMRDALEEARDLAARLRLAKDNAAIEPVRLTVADGFARFHDEQKGALPASRSAQVHHRAARAFWEGWLSPSTPWNRVPPSDVLAGLQQFTRQGKVPTAEKYLRCLRTVHRWLVDRHGLEGLKDPTRGIRVKEVLGGHEPRRPRYTGEELGKILGVAHEVDPRFRFALIWADHSGARSAALYRARRSHVDEALDIPPTPNQAPYGWANLPALKGQDRALTFLTLQQRLEFVRAIWKRWNGVRWVPGYLSRLEERYQQEGKDYPLIPGGVLPRDGVIRRARQVANNTLLNWLAEAEEKAEVPHVPRRGWHGVRRAWADYTMDQTDLDTVQAAGAWSDRDTPERIYLERVKRGRLAKSREAQEAKRD